MVNKPIRRIAFFTAGFAYNRLVRMIFYEKVFPKNIDIYLITTDKYKTRKSKIPQDNYKLSRTKIVTLHYGADLAFKIRKFCKENNIDRLINLGFHTSASLLFLATIFTRTDLCINILVDIFKQHYLANTLYEKVRDFLTLAMLFVFVKASKKVYFTDRLNAMRAPKFFMTPNEKMIFLAAPIDTSFFYPKNKASARHKLKFRSNEKIILYIGRANYLRCSDILRELIEKNKKWKFVVVGPLLDENLKIINAKNFINIKKLSQEKLVDYYAASDFVFCLNRGGGGIGLSSEEALSCGKPIIISKKFKVKESFGIYQIGINYAEAKNSIKSYFELPSKEKKRLAKNVRKYAYDKYSYDSWKDKYLKAYLN